MTATDPRQWNIGLVGYGEVGRILAEDLRKHEVLDARQLHQIMEETGATVAAKQPLPQGVPQVLTPPPPSDTMPIPPEIE